MIAIAEHVRLHGDGVRDIALWVDDAEAAWRETTSRGARSVREPETLRDEHGRSAYVVDRASTATPFTRFVERRNYRGAFLPGFEAVDGRGHAGAARGPEVHRSHGGQCRLGRDEPLGGFLPRRDGLPHVQALRRQRHFSTEYSALMSKVMSNGNERVKFPINEPAEGKRKSQIEEYLDFYHGPGVQHIAHGHRQHHRHGEQRCARRASISCACPPLTTTTCWRASARSTSRSTN